MRGVRKDIVAEPATTRARSFSIVLMFDGAAYGARAEDILAGGRYLRDPPIEGDLLGQGF